MASKFAISPQEIFAGAAAVSGGRTDTEIRELKGWIYSEGRGRYYPSINRVEEILEFLETNAMLNKKGRKFRHAIWEKYVKKETGG